MLSEIEVMITVYGEKVNEVDQKNSISEVKFFKQSFKLSSK